MDNNEFLNIGVGDKEPESLKPAKVQVQGIKLVTKHKKGTEEIAGELITLICKHPDKPETIELSNVKILVSEKVRLSALWQNLEDEVEGELRKLTKNSAAAKLLEFYGVANYGDLVGKEVETTIQSETNKYLCIKAY